MRQIHGQIFVTIPDANFVTYLQGIVPTAMSGNQMNTSSSQVTSYTQTINVNSLSIANLSGVQYFTSITYLDCGTNSLTSLPALPSSLTFLNCGGNPLINLPTLPTTLTVLYCNNNSLTSLPTLPNGLTYLDCTSNSLSTLPPLPNTLVHLTCFTNSLTTLPSIPNATTYLDCRYNALNILPALPNSLTYLNCGNNNITCFPNFPNSFAAGDFSIDPNPYNCLPNYISVMSAADLAKPLCAAGNSNGCAVATGINQIIYNTQVAVYPNPTSDQFYIETNATDKLTVDLFDVNGRHVFSKSVSDKSNISTATLDNGIYTLTITTADHVTNKKLVIVH